MSTPSSPPSPTAARMRRIGWVSLAFWACLGLALEAAHGFKWAPLLDDTLRREWLRWGHAHGVGLSLVLIAYAVAGGSPRRGPDARTGRLLVLGAWLLPLGFCLGAVWHYEADPGPGIVLAPLGGLCLVVALLRAAREAGE